MKNKFNYWRYLGLSKDTVDSFSDRISVDNIRILQIESCLIAILFFSASVVMMFNQYVLKNQIVLLVTAFANVIIYFLSSHVKKTGAVNLTKTANVLIVIFEALIYSAAMHIAIVAEHSYVALMVAALIACQISFDLKPERNLIIVLFTILLFGYFSDKKQSHTDHILSMINACYAAVFGNVFAWKKSRVRWEHEEAMELIQRSNSQLYRSSLTDPLTGLLNRRTAFDKLEVMAAQACVAKNEIVCLIMDLDNFKKFNDTYGHPAGDHLLEELGILLTSLQEKYDITISRIGGEEFMAYWNGQKNVDIDKFVTEVREGVKAIKHPDFEKGMYSTISIGIYKNTALKDDNSSRVYSKADCALYMAKKNGRDRAEYYDNSVEV